MKVNIKTLSLKELEEYITGKLNLKKYRFTQIRSWLYKKNAASIDDMTDISKDDRNILNENCYIGQIKYKEKYEASDKTTKLVFELFDNKCIETVIIPDEERTTLCISTQAGCKMGCLFCVTGRHGFKRNLESYEIIEQFQAVERLNIYQKPTNYVIMGMGEPLDNFNNLCTALEIITSSEGLAISPRRITLSTCGLIPEMLQFGELFPNVNLAVSLNASDEKTRSRLMPVNRRYSLTELLSALKKYPLPKRKMISLEYILIKGINDSTQAAEKLAEIAKGLKCKINLIVLNKGAGELEPPEEKTVLQFQQILKKANLTTTIRKSKGSDIFAACGQLGKNI